MKIFFLVFFLLTGQYVARAQSGAEKNRLVYIGDGWAKNTVNTVVYRKNSLVTYRDTQFAAFYNDGAHIVIAKRKVGSTTWKIKVTPLTGDVTDAHKSISIMADGDGYIHMAWGHHASVLNYAKSVAPGALDFTERVPMTGSRETKVTYPEFYRLPNGNLLFLYRDGGSGNGNLMLNSYNIKSRQWVQLQNGFLDGEGQRNAYWQMDIDKFGTIHLSWVWRERPDVATNHDMGYARSKDGGKTWEKSTGEKYSLPITAATAEYACKIPQKSELINQTSMSVNDDGEPYIATYWHEAGSAIPQYHIIYYEKGKWSVVQVSERKTPFSLSGPGTKKIPISRPQVMVTGKGDATHGIMIFRDEERGNKVSIAVLADIPNGKFTIKDIYNDPLGSWEPSYDTELWKSKNILHIFIQKTGQGDGEKLEELAPTPVSVLEINKQP